MPGKTRKKEALVVRRFLYKKYFLFLAVPLLFLADQIVKQVIVRLFSENQSVPVVTGIFYLTRVNNTGAAFGLFRGAGMVLILITLVSIAVLCAFLIRHWEKVRPLQLGGWTLVIGGALGNLRDRLLYGYVIDFLDFRVWPVFNLADIFVCTGVFLVALSAFRNK